MIKRNGFSLIELLNAVAIGSIVISVLIGLYLHFEKSSLVERRISDIQENARFATHILHSTITQAGLIGSARLSDSFPVINKGVSKNNNISYHNHFMVFQGTGDGWVPILPKGFHIMPKKDSDVILIRSIAPITNRLLFIRGNHLILESNPEFQENDDIVISDTQHAVLAHINHVFFDREGQHILLSQALKEKFNRGAEVGKLETTIFFIGKTQRRDQSGKEVYALYMIKESNRKIELIPNVSNLKVQCLEKVNDRLFTKDPQEIRNWPNVSAVKITLWLYADEIISDNSRIFQFIIPLKEHLS